MDPKHNWFQGFCCVFWELKIKIYYVIIISTLIEYTCLTHSADVWLYVLTYNETSAECVTTTITIINY